MTALAGLSLLGTFAAGCGLVVDGGRFGQPLFVSECDGPLAGEVEAVDTIVLDWTGGTNPIYPEVEFDGLDLALFKTGKRSTLAGDAELFRELVRQEIVTIFCDAPDVNIRVLSKSDVREGPGAPGLAPAAQEGDVTTVLLTQSLQPDDGPDIGEGQYDPCNREHDNAAIIFGEQIRRLASTNTLEEWVALFANVCAHEIGHTLGFGHIERDSSLPIQRPLYVELMLAGHTLDEMRRPQRIILEQTNCPDDFSAARRGVHASSLP